MARVRRQEARPTPKKWVQRSLSFPVQECRSMPWKELMQLLHDSWRHSTMLANWARHTLTCCDIVRTPELTVLPEYRPVDLYALAFGRAGEKQSRLRVGCPECRRSWWPVQVNGCVPEHGPEGKPCPGVGKPLAERPRGTLPAVPVHYDAAGFWGGAKSSAQSILKKVQTKYAQERLRTIWLRERRSPEFVYPYPFPVHQDSWVPSLGDSKALLINLALPGGRVALRLRRDNSRPHFLRTFEEIVAGDVAQQELTISRQRSHANVPRDFQRSPGGDQRTGYRVMVRIAYRREVLDNPDQVTATVTTGSAPFLTVLVPGRPPWLLYAPWVQRWIAEHRRFLFEFANDMKFEKRWPRRKREAMQSYSDARCDKHAKRMKTFRLQTAAQVVGYCSRNHCGRIVWDCRDRTFAESFPWSLLETDLQNKCDEAAIYLETVASGATKNDESADDSPGT